MKDRTCIVTGATDGIGKITARTLAEQGAHVILVAQNAEKGAVVVDEILQLTGNRELQFLPADLSSQADIRQLANTILHRCQHIDVLINNAGAIFMRRQESVDGIEMTWALNHLGYFLLTQLLLERIIESGRSRIVNVSSIVHRGMSLNVGDLEFKQGYAGFKAYRHSKLANILFTRALAKRLANTEVTANCLHPGAVGSHFGWNNGAFARFFLKLGRPFLKTPEQGAQTSIHLAVSPAVENISGEYFENKKSAQPSQAAQDEGMSEKLWQLSEQMTRQ
ncbi:MAG: SDR family oxidoreductase [Pseudomonadota bacterium]